MTYMLEGGSSRDFNLSRQFLWSETAQSEKILRILSEYIVYFLSLQAKAGANVLMLFDSWAGVVPVAWRKSVIIDMHNQIISDLRARNIQLPIISFPKGLSEGLIDYSDQVDIQALGLDHYTDRHWDTQFARKDIVTGEYGSAGTGRGRGSDEGRNRRYSGMFFRQAAYFQSGTWNCAANPA